MRLKRITLLLILSSVILLVLVDWNFMLEGHPKPEDQQAELSAHLRERSNALSKEIKNFSGSACRELASYKNFPKNWKGLYQQQGLVFTGYTGNSTFFWSDNSVPVSFTDVRDRNTNKLWKLKNGWYIAHRDTFGPCVVLGLALVRNEYSYQNDYLRNGYPFLPDFPAETRITLAHEEGSLALSNGEIPEIARIQPTGEVHHTNGSKAWMNSLSPLVILLLLLGLHTFVKSFAGQKKSAWLLLWLALLVLRILSFYFKVPHALYALNIFNPSEYAASNWLPTLGDLFINSIFLLYTAYLVQLVLTPKQGSKIQSAFVFGLLTSLLLIFSIWISELIAGLIINSSISLDIRDVLNLTSSSYVSFAIIGILFGSIYLFVDVLTQHLPKDIHRKKVIAILAFATLPAIAFGLLSSWHQLIPLGIILLVVGIKFNAQSQSRGIEYAHIISLIICFAALGTYLILHNTHQREQDKRKLLAVKISAERDPIAESLFLETEQKLLTDPILKSYLRPGTVATGQVRDLAQLYFNGYWEKYSISVNVFGADECPMTTLYTTSISDPLRFDRLIDSVGMFTQSERFFFLDDGSGRISYMARLPILNENEDPVPLGTLYIEFQSRYTPEEIGYPELLLDKVVSTRTDLSSYSYARYIKGRLVSHYGTYPYELTSNVFKNSSKGEFTFFERDGESHLIYRPSQDALVVLSRPIDGVLGILTPFSYLVLFFSFLVLIPSGMREIRRGGYFAPISFKRRIQLSIVLLLFVSLILIGGGTIVYIISNSNEKNLKNISEKIHSLLIETEYILAKDAKLYPQKAEDVAYSLTRQANVFFSDINIYDPSGYLYASSRPKIFEEGLVSKNMNPEAFYGLSVRNSTEFTHEERIGNLNYVSSYVPLRNFENKVIGYLNLPYFARQNELRKEIATFVVSIVNIYVLLIVLVVITAIFLSNRVTAPLQLIREKLSRIRLGKKNEIIEWKGSDEIADLIGEYNRMVSELAESADRLARSERESAWREMAKQVAHEIKNPLTPMKLSTQLLKRAWDDKAPEFDQRIERFTNNLIEQIDSLSHIATEFSNFAKMPKMSPETVDLSIILQSIVDFHQGEEEVEINLNCQEHQACWVYTDKEQLLRVFNNLIRNAIQAIPEQKQGKIDIRMSREKKSYIVAIQDNGTGISDELKEKIFSPNFTTKNGGMGLGLALVKNIVEGSSGKIWFESTVDQGTTFFIQLPIYEPEQRP